MAPSSSVDRISVLDARRLFLHSQAILNGDHSSLLKLIEKIGFVQVDSINVLERAHHLILAARMESYRRPMLDKISRHTFEHWTHDASIIPAKWFAHWRPRFERYRAGSWHLKQIGKNADRIIADVFARVRRDGPLMSKDFEHDRERGVNAWWEWKPQKLALDYLWRIGELFVVGRKNFHKVYDVTERAAPQLHSQEAPTDEQHIEWACRTALERLGVATSREIRDFWRALKLPQVEGWIKSQLASGEIIEVCVESVDASTPTRAVAFADVRKQLKNLPAPSNRIRLLTPFDPITRDRARASRLFNFEYRFEAYVPKAKRQGGYYVMPILEGDRLIGRLDPKLHRDRNELEIKFVQFEKGVKLDRKRRARFDEAIDRLAAFVGASKIKLSV